MAYASRCGNVKPDIDSQGSDQLLGTLYKEALKGQIPFVQIKHIIAKVPELDTKLSSAAIETVEATSGLVKKTEMEQRGAPHSWDNWRRMLSIWQTSLLMAIYSAPQSTNLQIDKSVLDDLYKWIDGPDLARRQDSPPSLITIMNTEREMWRRICIDIHKGATLHDAIKTMRMDLLFWQREVYDKKQPQTTQP